VSIFKIYVVHRLYFTASHTFISPVVIELKIIMLL